jgi:hypothetical protein
MAGALQAIVIIFLEKGNKPTWVVFFEAAANPVPQAKFLAVSYLDAKSNPQGLKGRD